MKKFLMCEPRAFAVNYEINPWMNSNIGKVNYELAYEQWKSLYNKIKNSGAEVLVMKEQPENLPDLVFTANAALTINGHALISHFACKERQPESPIYSEFLDKSGLKSDNYFIDNNIYFEGAGDALLEKHKNILVLGYGFRTSKEAYGYVKQFLTKVSSETKLLHAELINPNFYHLDTCFCPLDNGYVLYYPGAFSERTIKEFKEAFGDRLIALSKEDADAFGCNAVSIGNVLVLNKVSKDLKNKLGLLEITVIENSLSQYMLSGGSSKCLTLELSQKI
jgi:N-dimethylarginine dimethylaminohydrolase